MGKLSSQGLERLDAEVAARTAQLTGLALHLQQAREDERHRLAQDLHDELGALLTSAKLDAARIRSRLAGAPPEAQERLAHLVETLDRIIGLKRRIVEDLRPSALRHLGLMATLDILAREFAAASGVPVHATLAQVPLAASAELVVYRLVQEALTNIGKHAQPRQVWLELREHGNRVTVSVRDDGVGFDADSRLASAYGLVSMRYRVAAERGSLSVTSMPGSGTLIEATLPAASA
jgi:signal transduction histidine kinase